MCLEISWGNGYATSRFRKGTGVECVGGGGAGHNAQLHSRSLHNLVKEGNVCGFFKTLARNLTKFPPPYSP